MSAANAKIANFSMINGFQSAKFIYHHKAENMGQRPANDRMDANKFGSIQLGLMKSLGFDEDALALIKKIFFEFASPDEKMSSAGFADFLRSYDLVRDSKRSDHYFRAFDDRNQGFLLANQFISGLAALDPAANHGGDVGELRCRYIFRFYCTQHSAKAAMTFEDFRSMAEDIAIQRSPKLAVGTESFDRAIAEHLFHFESDFNMNKLIRKVGSLKLRGTSALFRANGPVLAKLTKPVRPVQNADEEMVQEFKPAVVKDNGVQTDVDFRISHAVLHITAAGCIAEKMSEFKDSASMDGETPSAVSQGTRRLLQQAESEDLDNRVKAITCSTDVLRGLDFFYRPYQLKPQPANGQSCQNGAHLQHKPPLDWFDIRKPKLAMCIIKLCRYLRPILLAEPRCLKLHQPIYIFGDLHGNYEDLHEFERLFWPMGPEHSIANILCLGDYVDRGDFGLEVVSYLFALKLMCPQKVHLLRGNHELRAQQTNFDFRRECTEKLNEHGESVWEAINSCFDCLPLAAIIDNKVLCVHGGIPHPGFCVVPSANETQFDFAALVHQTCQCPAASFPPNSVPWEILWNDPVWEEDPAVVKFDKDGFALNTKRDTGHEFSKAALDVFLNRFGLSHLIRAHQVQSAGFQLRYDTKCLTVFSSSTYSGLENKAAVAMVNDGSVKLISLSMQERRQSGSVDKENETKATGGQPCNGPSMKNIGPFAKR